MMKKQQIKNIVNYVITWHTKKNTLLKTGSDEAVKEKEIEEKAIK